jgi:hypothetical protein
MQSEKATCLKLISQKGLESLSSLQCSLNSDGSTVVDNSIDSDQCSNVQHHCSMMNVHATNKGKLRMAGQKDADAYLLFTTVSGNIYCLVTTSSLDST